MAEKSPFPLWDQPIVKSSDSQSAKQFACIAMHTAMHWFIEFGPQIPDPKVLAVLRKEARRRGLWAEQTEWIIGYAFAEYGVDYGDIRPS